MTTPEEFLGRHPNASRKQIMKACGVSARVAQRAELQQEAEGSRGSYWAPAATLLAIAVVGLCAAWLGKPETETQAAESQSTTVDNRAEITELYAALDRKDRAALPAAVANLESEDPQLRLASLRVIAKLDPNPHAVGILALTRDSDARVRRAAIQLAGRLKHDRAAEDLVALAVDTQRPLSERVLALGSLRNQTGFDASALLPLLDDPRVSGGALEVLERVSGKSLNPVNGETLRQAWTRELGVGA